MDSKNPSPRYYRSRAAGVSFRPRAKAGTCLRHVFVTCPDIDPRSAHMKKESRTAGSLRLVFDLSDSYRASCDLSPRNLLRSVPAGIDRFHFQKPPHQVLHCLEDANRSVSNLHIPLLPILERPGEPPDCVHSVGHRSFPFHASVRTQMTSQFQKGLSASRESGRASPHRGALPPDPTLSICRQIVNHL